MGTIFKKTNVIINKNLEFYKIRFNSFIGSKKTENNKMIEDDSTKIMIELKEKHISTEITSVYENNTYKSNFFMTSKHKSKELDTVIDNCLFSKIRYDGTNKEQYLNPNGIHYKENYKGIIKDRADFDDNFLMNVEDCRLNWENIIEKNVYKFHECINKIKLNCLDEDCMVYLNSTKELTKIYLNTKGIYF